MHGPLYSDGKRNKSRFRGRSQRVIYCLQSFVNPELILTPPPTPTPTPSFSFLSSSTSPPNLFLFFCFLFLFFVLFFAQGKASFTNKEDMRLYAYNNSVTFMCVCVCVGGRGVGNEGIG